MAKSNSRRTTKKVTRSPKITPKEALSAKPDLSMVDAKKGLITEILDECIKIEEGKIQTVFPLVKLTRQYKELINTVAQ